MAAHLTGRDAPEISIVIPTMGRASLLREMLHALSRQSYDPRRVEVIVVHDGSDADTRSLLDVMRADAAWTLVNVERPRRGRAAARNAGIARACGRIIVMLDDDIIASPGLLAEHARHHAGSANIVVTGNVPVERLAEEPAHHRAVRQYWETQLSRRTAAGHRPAFTDFTTGNASVSRLRLLEAGGFDEAFVEYGREDYELGYRLQRAGLRFVYEARALGTHRYHKDPLEWLRQSRTMGRADVLFARKHPELVNEIMALVPYPRVPWLPWAVQLSERATLGLNVGGGKLWGVAATFAQGAHYWQGVREEVRDPIELRRLVAARVAARARPTPAATA